MSRASLRGMAALFALVAGVAGCGNVVHFKQPPTPTGKTEVLHWVDCAGSQEVCDRAFVRAQASDPRGALEILRGGLPRRKLGPEDPAATAAASGLYANMALMLLAEGRFEQAIQYTLRSHALQRVNATDIGSAKERSAVAELAATVWAYRESRIDFRGMSASAPQRIRGGILGCFAPKRIQDNGLCLEGKPARPAGACRPGDLVGCAEACNDFNQEACYHYTLLDLYGYIRREGGYVAFYRKLQVACESGVLGACLSLAALQGGHVYVNDDSQLPWERKTRTPGFDAAAAAARACQAGMPLGCDIQPELLPRVTPRAAGSSPRRCRDRSSGAALRPSRRVASCHPSQPA